MSEAPRCRHCGTSLPGSGGDAATGTARSGHSPDTRNGHAPDGANGHAPANGDVPDRGAGHPPGAVSGPMATERALDSLYQEVRRIREIAESRPGESRPAESRPGEVRAAEVRAGRAAGDDRRRIEELTREVQELRITVARLRGMAVPGAVRSA